MAARPGDDAPDRRCRGHDGRHLFRPLCEPAGVWFFPLLGLAAPAIYVATVILALYWVIRWRLLRAGTILALVVIGLFKVSLFYKPEFRRSYGEESYDRRAFKVMTYNVRSFFGESGASNVDDIVRLIGEYDPDIVCMQEFNARLAEKSDDFALLDEKYESAAFGRTQAPDSLYGASLFILSKYRILRSGIVLTPNTSVWADLLIGDDTVRVFNNHLRSTAIKAADNEYITNRDFISDTAREVKIRSIVSRLRENSILRAAQVDSIADVIADARARCIVCGDFNDTPMSYVYRTMAGGAERRFQQERFGLFAYFPRLLQYAAYRLCPLLRQFRPGFLRGAAGRIFGSPARRGASPKESTE